MRALILVLGLVACSTPQTLTATKDPTTNPNAPTPTKSNAVSSARTLRFAYDVSREISCSLSFEDDSQYGSYVLTVTPPHAATLVYQRVKTHRFGQNPFSKPSSPPNVSEQRFVSSFEGSVVQTGAVLSFSLQRRQDECAKGAPGCDGTLTLSCQDAVASIVSFDDEGKHVADRTVLRCTPEFGLPFELTSAGWKGGLVFGDGSGLFLDYPESGPMEHPPELRLAP